MGFGARGRVWRPTVEGLRGRHRVVTFDHRGIGESDVSGRLWTLRTLADDALRVLGDLGWETAHIVGVSMGGMVAQELALAAPQKVRSLSLIATHPGGRGPSLPPLEGIRRFLRTFTAKDDERAAVLARLLHTEAFLKSVDPVALEQRMADIMAGKPSWRALLGQLAAVLRHNTRPRLAGLEAPTLIVRPGADLLVRSSGSDVLAEHIPDVDVLHCESSGHGVIFQQSVRVNRRLAEHIATAEALRSTPEGLRAVS